MYRIGIDIGGSHILAGIVTAEGEIVTSAEVSNSRQKSYQEMVKDIFKLCKKITSDANIPLKGIESIGIGCPGVCDNKKGILIYANNLNIVNAPIRQEFQKHIDIPIHIENDANCAALAENCFGAARNTHSSVTITLGTGLGGGIIIENKVFSGFNFAGSELGHMTIMIDGEQCNCGRKGCWEAYSSATGLVKIALKHIKSNPNSLILEMVQNDVSKITGKIIFDAVKDHDEIAKEILSEYTLYLAEGIVNIINIIMPEILVIGGGISGAGNHFIDDLRKLVYSKVHVKEESMRTRIELAQLGNEAGMIGAAMLG